MAPSHDVGRVVMCEPERIVSLGLIASEKHRADWMRAQITAALHKAAAHGRDGPADNDPPRAAW